MQSPSVITVPIGQVSDQELHILGGSQVHREEQHISSISVQQVSIKVCRVSPCGHMLDESMVRHIHCLLLFKEAKAATLQPANDLVGSGSNLH